jgi:hypothetical protein
MISWGTVDDFRKSELWVYPYRLMQWDLSSGFDGMGDLVSRGTLHVKKKAISPLVDLPLLARVKEVAAKTTKGDEAAFFASFLETWERPDEHF